VGFSLKKLARGALKLGKKLAPQLVGLTPVGGLVGRAQQAAKALGINLTKPKARPQPLSVQAAIMKPVATMPIARESSRRSAILAPMALGSRRKAKRPAAKGRAAPTGGLDLKRIAAMWRAQGKPGTWLGFIKANSDVRK